MHRSEINNYIKCAMELFEEYSYPLPKFAYMTPGEIKELKSEGKSSEIFDCGLGWDVTDFGSGNFYKKGLLLFTVRNGKVNTKYTKPYAEKLMVVEVGQVTPYHYHSYKQEDIINRGGGNLILQAYNSGPNNEKLDTDIVVSIDGTEHSFKAGERIVIEPGCSICLPQRLFHTFYGEEQTVVVGEVSMCNDDNTDNIFYEKLPRFSDIIEDEEMEFVLVQDYDKIQSAMMNTFFTEFWNFPIYTAKTFVLTSGHLILGVLVFAFGLIFSSVLKKILDKRLRTHLKSLSDNDIVLIKKLVYYLSIIIFTYIALSILSIPLAALSFLIGGVGIGLGFGLKDYVSNFISGLVIVIERPFVVQDVVNINGNIGRIFDISLRSVRIHTEENIDIIIPNNVVLSNPIENWTRGDKMVLSFVTMQLDYNVDIVKATEVMKNAALQVNGVLNNPEPFVLFTEHGAYSLNFKVYFAANIHNKLERWQFESEVNYALNKALRENNISIAYPTTNINLAKQ